MTICIFAIRGEGSIMKKLVLVKNYIDVFFNCAYHAHESTSRHQNYMFKHLLVKLSVYRIFFKLTRKTPKIF